MAAGFPGPDVTVTRALNVIVKDKVSPALYVRDAGALDNLAVGAAPVARTLTEAFGTADWLTVAATDTSAASGDELADTPPNKVPLSNDRRGDA